MADKGSIQQSDLSNESSSFTDAMGSSSMAEMSHQASSAEQPMPKIKHYWCRSEHPVDYDVGKNSMDRLRRFYPVREGIICVIHL